MVCVFLKCLLIQKKKKNSMMKVDVCDLIRDNLRFECLVCKNDEKIGWPSRLSLNKSDDYILTLPTVKYHRTLSNHHSRFIILFFVYYIVPSFWSTQHPVIVVHSGDTWKFKDFILNRLWHKQTLHSFGRSLPLKLICVKDELPAGSWM